VITFRHFWDARTFVPRSVAHRHFLPPDAPFEVAQPVDVFVLRHEDEPVGGSVVPDCPVAAGCKGNGSDMGRTGYRSDRADTNAAARFSSKRSLGSGSGNTHNPPLAFGGEREAGSDVIAPQLRKVREDLVFAHAGSEVGEDITDGHASSADARLAEPDLRILEREQIQRDPEYFLSRAFRRDDCLALHSAGSRRAPVTIFHDPAAVFQNAAHGERERSMITAHLGRWAG
jgi:hypothetical protein